MDFLFPFIAVVTPLLASSQVNDFTVVAEERVEPIMADLGPLFNTHAETMFVTDVAVSRREHFVAK